MQSFMGRVNYSYKNKYMFSGSVRYDGASQLAEGNKYNNFTAFSLGWNLMEEKFMKRLKDMVPEFKIRGSYGTVGNAAVPAYSSHLKFYPGMDDSGNPTLAISDLGNENLKWERTRELNIGIDSRWWGGRLSFSAEYYNKKTTDLLMWQKVPSVLGVSSILTNVGSVSNKGFDIMLGGIPVSTKHFKWDINYTLNINKIRFSNWTGSLIRLLQPVPIIRDWWVLMSRWWDNRWAHSSDIPLPVFGRNQKFRRLRFTEQSPEMPNM